MKLNLACGGDLRLGSEWVNADRQPWTDGVIRFDFDKETLAEKWGKDYFDEIYCKGALIEFSKNAIEVFNEFYDVCVDGATITVITSVVDNGMGTFRDPIAKHHYHSEWSDYIAGQRVSGGRGLGLYGNFEMMFNEIAGEVQTVIYMVIKHG